jgi:hypothetical protein
MKYHPVRRVSGTLLALVVWGVLLAGAAQAKLSPDDPSAPFVTQPAVVITEPVSWTRYALVAAVACLVGITATLAVQFVLGHGRRASMAHA